MGLLSWLARFTETTSYERIWGEILSMITEDGPTVEVSMITVEVAEEDERRWAAATRVGPRAGEGGCRSSPVLLPKGWRGRFLGCD